MLKNFSVQNFRTFQQLDIERLGRVNLIVGRNCTGKTTLLEAIWLYACRLRPDAIHQVLFDRDETRADRGVERGDYGLDIDALFHGRQLGIQSRLTLGPCDDAKERISLRATWLERQPRGAESATSKLVEVSEGDIGAVEGDVYPAVAIEYGDGERTYFQHDAFTYYDFRRYRSRRPDMLPPFLRATGIGEEIAAKWWDTISLTDSESRIIELLGLLAPIERITLVESPKAPRTRVFKVRLKGDKTPQPLRSLGDGVQRLFQTVLALERAQGNVAREPQLELFPVPSESESLEKRVLLVDEVESGIHYSVITDYWRLILDLARKRDVQVFATTHSWDCVEGFQRAAAANGEDDALLIRLEAHEGKSRAIVFSQEELAVATRDSIEVR